MDLYERLGVRRAAGGAEIRRAWQRLSRALHPAVNPGDPVAAERYREAARAFEILGDPLQRAAYDRGELAAEPVEPHVEGGFEGFDFEARVRVESVGFRDIFEHALPQADAPPGEDVEQATRVSFEESMQGAARRVHLVRFEACAGCSGTGEVKFAPVPCARCSGSGSVRGSRGHMIFSRPCRECDGRGEKSRRPCPRCSGEGRALTSEWLEVRIPAGVGNGARVRLPGAGNSGRRGGPPGDFVLTVEVDEHPVFKREGADLHCSVPVSMVSAAMGGHVDVATPDGNVTIEVPAGTQNGQRFRLRKRGVPRPDDGGRGDLWVEVQVLIPAVTDDRARSLLKELGAVLGAGNERP